MSEGGERRSRLPNRRHQVCETLAVTIGGGNEIVFEVCVGIDAGGTAREIFVSFKDLHSDRAAMIEDWAITASILLQHHVSVAVLAAQLADKQGRPVSPVGHAAALAARIEAEEGPKIEKEFLAGLHRRRAPEVKRALGGGSISPGAGA